MEGLEGVMREVEAFLGGEFEAVNERLRATGGDAIGPGGVGVEGVTQSTDYAGHYKGS